MTEEIKKLIEEEAERYAQTVLPYMRNQSLYTHEMAYADCVKHGASFILHKNRWRKVEEELPEVFGAGTSIPVLVKTKYGTYHVAVYSKPHDDFIEIPYSVAGVTEWKPIS